MFTYFREHARQNVWCAPDQDNQILLAAKKITAPGGEKVSFPIMTRRLSLPTTDRRYHVYQIGQVTPKVLGLLPATPAWARGQWISFSDVVEAISTFVTLYTDLGVHVPIHRSYYMYTADKALIFAVEVNSKIAYDIETERLYLRLYRNAYFSTEGADNLPYTTRAGGAHLLNMETILQLQTQVQLYRQKPGAVLCFRNGQLINDISPLTVSIGDVVEYLYDASVKRVVDLPVSSLKSFTSELDGAYKYLLHYEGVDENQIDYIDDIDVYIVKPQSATRFTGRYYHRNLASAQRMVTHRDYSIRTDHYANVAQGLEAHLGLPQSDLRDYTVRLYIRHGGLPRPLIYENQRIFELYKLPNDKVEAAMLGVHATVPLWTAAALENASYAELMRVKYEDIDIELIERAYGYNGMTKVLGDTPSVAVQENGYRIARLPIGLYQDSTVYEYDSSGTLLGYYHHDEGTIYHPRNAECRLVEGIVGLGSTEPSVYYGQDLLPVPTEFSYRVYMCYLVDGQPNNNWVDITDSVHYTVENGRLVWQNLETEQWLMIRSDERFLTYELELTPIAGTLYFDLSEVVDGVERLMTVQAGDLDIWLNGKSLIEDLGYQVQFPRVYIVDKKHLKQPAGSTPQKITVRFTGLAEPDMQRKKPEDRGFVAHGLLSSNNRFDIRDDKVLRITLDGALKHRSDVEFSEEHSGVSILNALNGQPYQIKDIVVPLRGYTVSETYALRQTSVEIDTVVEDYMSEWFPEPDRGELSAIPQRYPLVSPFFCHLVNDLVSGQFNRSSIDKELSDQEVLALCQPYEFLLSFDPINPDLGYDHRYVVIHPHQLYNTLEVSLQAYRFLQIVVRLYGRGLISLSQHVTINLGA